jgi:hypothetical protein
MKRASILLAILVIRTVAAQEAAPNRDAIDRALGRSGALQGDVYRVTAPRSDLTVRIGDVTLRPGLALGTWMAFRRVGFETVAHGDLVLLEREVNPVISALQAARIDITAVHNHVLEETPRIMYVHFWGRGDAQALAEGLRRALERTATPPAAPAGAAPAGADAALPGWADAVAGAVGAKGTYRGAVLSIAVPRPERISMMGVELPPSMGMATAINVQEVDGGRVAATGDFVLTGDEVNAPAHALRDRGVAITSLHNHMIHGAPELYFMHFWAVDTPETVGRALKAGLDAMKTRR